MSVPGGSDEVRGALRRELYRLKENVDRSARHRTLAIRSNWLWIHLHDQA